MKRTLLGLVMAMLMVAATAFASLSGMARSSSETPAAETTVIGFISDSMCGMKHMSGMGDDQSCTLACVKQGSKFVLADRDHKRVYQLDKAGQDKARDFAGQKVKVTGKISGRTIRVTNIEATS